MTDQVVTLLRTMEVDQLQFIQDQIDRLIPRRMTQQLTERLRRIKGFNGCDVSYNLTENRTSGVPDERASVVINLRPVNMQVTMKGYSDGRASVNAWLNNGSLHFVDLNTEGHAVFGPSGLPGWNTHDTFSLMTLIQGVCMPKTGRLAGMIYRAYGHPKLVNTPDAQIEAAENEIFEDVWPLLADLDYDTLDVVYSIQNITEDVRVRLYEGETLVGLIGGYWNRLNEAFPSYELTYNGVPKDVAKMVIQVAMPMYGARLVGQMG